MNQAAAVSAALLAVSCLGVGAWSAGKHRADRYGFYAALFPVCLLAAAVGYLLIRDLPGIWPFGLSLAVLVDAYACWPLLRGAKPVVRTRTRTYVAVASLLVASLSLAATAKADPAAGPQTAIGSAINASERSDLNAVQGVVGQDAQIQLQNAAIARRFDVLCVASDGNLAIRCAGQPLPAGADLSLLAPYLARASGATAAGLLAMADGTAAELILVPDGQNRLVGLKYLTGAELGELDPGASWAIVTVSGLTAAVPSALPVSLWQSASLTPDLRGDYAATAQGKRYDLEAWSQPTLDGSMLTVLSLTP